MSFITGFEKSLKKDNNGSEKYSLPNANLNDEDFKYLNQMDRNSDAIPPAQEESFKIVPMSKNEQS